MNKESARTAIIAIVIVVVTFVTWSNRTLSRSVDTSQKALATCQVALTSAREEAVVQALAACKECQVAAKKEGYMQAQRDHEEVKNETEALARPKCNPFLPPYFPCCGEDAQPGGLTEETWPTLKEFKARRGLLTLACAHTKSGVVGPLWVCGRNESVCERSEQRAGACLVCYVHLASGRVSGEDYTWTGHAIDEVDGPWTADGKSGVFP